MNRGAALPLLVAALLFAVAPGTEAQPPAFPDRESTYPPQVTNVTHEPWAPKAGDDVAVTVHLDPAHPLPDNVTLLYCRVEPEYVCGMPFRLDADPHAPTFRGTIAWDDLFMDEKTRHVGYNITLRYDDTERRVYAPIGNHWVPPTYPADSDGTYYFYALSGKNPADAPLPAPALALLALLAIVAAQRRPRLAP